MLPISIEAESGSANWYAARRGMLTASKMNDAMAFKQKGGPAQVRIDYMMDLVAERMTGIATTHFVTEAMQWGTDQEANAIAAFEDLSGILVHRGGLVLHPKIEFFGATPDGFITSPEMPLAIVEVKCPTTSTFVEWRLAGEIPEKHRRQMLAQMACCRTQDGIFIAYDPRVKVGRNMIFYPLVATAADIEEIEAAAKVFLEETEQMFRKVTEAS